jgi:glycosyltransferase involved in cell wall biosynthesis
MYQELPAHINNFVEPWLLPLELRQEMLTNGRFKMAYFYEKPNNSTFRYRSYNMCEAINSKSSHSTLSASFFFVDDLSIFEWLAKTADLLIVCRSGLTESLLRLITLFKDKGKVVIFDVDDLVFDPSFSMQLAIALGQDPSDARTLDYWHAYTSRMRETAILCDGITTTNSYLASIATQILGIQSYVINNSLNKDQILISRGIYKSKIANSFSRNSRFTIGYFSGSPSHKRDFELIANALKKLLDKKPFVDIVIAGYIELGESLSGYSDRVFYEPFRDYISLQHLIATCEICVAPLEHSTFTNCKSELKYFESAVVGTACMASPTFTFRRAINNGVNGYICRAHEWLPGLIAAADDPGRIAEISQNAFCAAISRYGPRAIFNQITTALDLRHVLMS